MSHNRNRRLDAGFTIVELLMAMAFVAILLIVITMTVIQISNSYNKGLTMRAVDQAGRTISADIRQTLSQSQPIDVASHLCKQTANGGCTQNVGDIVAGRLCTGQYTYVWNLWNSVNSDNPPNVYKANNSSTNKIHFVRVRDNGGQYCSSPGTAIDNTSTGGDPREFLTGGDADLVIQNFDMHEIIRDDAIGQALYDVVLEIGTNGDKTIDHIQHLDTIDASCKPPSDDSALIDFCAVNQFDFTAQAGNEGGGQ